MQIVKKYFPDIPGGQLQLLEQLYPLYREWNQRINVISRKDIDHFYERHVLHSLAILKAIRFREGARVLDVGTGGGFPGIPLAICSPGVRFTLVDSIGKKIQVVNGIVDSLQISNVETIRARAEQLEGEWEFITSRAVKPLPQFVRWTRGRISVSNRHDLPNGIFYLKGGNFADELKKTGMQCDVIPLSRFFEETFFQTKKLVYLYKK